MGQGQPARACCDGRSFQRGGCRPSRRAEASTSQPARTTASKDCRGGEVPSIRAIPILPQARKAAAGAAPVPGGALSGAAPRASARSAPPRPRACARNCRLPQGRGRGGGQGVICDESVGLGCLALAVHRDLVPEQAAADGAGGATRQAADGVCLGGVGCKHRADHKRGLGARSGGH